MKKNAAAAIMLALSAAYLAAAVLLARSGYSRSFLFYPGFFLYYYFLEAAFYIPVYLFFCSFFLVYKEFKKEQIIILILTIIPFLTAGMLLRLLFLTNVSAFEAVIIKSFGKFAPVIVFLLMVIEIIIIIKIALTFGASEEISEEISSDISSEKSEESPGNENLNATDLNSAEVSQHKIEAYRELTLSHVNEKKDSEDDFYDADAEIDAEIDAETDAETEIEEEPEIIDQVSMAVMSVEPIEDPDINRPFPADAADTADDDFVRPAVVQEYFSSHKSIKAKKTSYSIPSEVLDVYHEEIPYTIIDDRTREEAEILRQTLAEFKIEAEVTGIRKGPVITMFEILPAPGVKLSRISNLADNIALRLAASRVRIVAPIPGKHAVGIEVPNRKRAIVSFRELIEVDYPQYAKYNLPIILGKDITGEEQIIDLTQTPHLLIAGATGSGKSVCVNSIITTLLFTKKPEEVKLILIDPKIVELKLYNDIPHLLTPVITDSKRAFQSLQYCIFEMEKRYALLDALGVRDINSFNRKIRSKNIATLPLPYIVVVVDEFADLMATTGKELESTLARLAAMSRAVGIHLVLATQRPSIDVITGLIKANIPSRIAFMVASKTDSRIIIDSSGAEMLLGRGDMLFTSAWNPYLTRIQGSFLSEHEVERVVEKVKEYGEPEYIDDEMFFDDDPDLPSDYNDYGEDPLMDKALEIVSTAGKASASYLQRRLKIGYNRAARIVEEMERRGIVGPQNGSKPRDILNMPDF